jgi:hypothetical protein
LRVEIYVDDGSSYFLQTNKINYYGGKKRINGEFMKSASTMMRNSLTGVFILSLLVLTFYFFQAKERGIRDMKDTVQVSNVSIPPMDTRTPEKTETATFALG